jgi:hypothetical protein
LNGKCDDFTVNPKRKRKGGDPQRMEETEKVMTLGLKVHKAQGQAALILFRDLNLKSRKRTKNRLKSKILSLVR